MSDDNLWKWLAEYRRLMNEAIPESLRQFINSPAYQEIRRMEEKARENIPTALEALRRSQAFQETAELARRAQETIPPAIQQLAEELAPYADLVRELDFYTPLIQSLTRASQRWQVYSKLGGVQFVLWQSLPDAFVDQAVTLDTDEGINDLLSVCLNDIEDVEETIQLCRECDQIKDHPVFEQSVTAYHNGQYDLAAMGFTSMIDKLLAIYSGQVRNPRFKPRVEAIVEKIGENAILSNDEYSDIILLMTFKTAMETFIGDSHFDEEEPHYLNRHWIMHGRSERQKNKLDCVKVIHLLYGTILVSELIR